MTENPTAPRRVTGGKAIYGARLGILMLEARFPRIPGDMGNAGTWPFPVLYKVVHGATPHQVVTRRGEGLAAAFLDAASQLVAEGAEGITTNCGFLSLLQHQLAEHCGVPVATSALMQAPLITATLPPGKRAGILTISKASLTAQHLEAAGVDLTTPIQGTEGGREFTRVILNDELEMDVAAAERDILDAGHALLDSHPDIGAILLECTNMPPYARALRDSIGLPVFDIYTMITWFHASLAPRNFDRPQAPQAIGNKK